MRTCKEIIDSYFQVKFKTGLIAGAGSSSPSQQHDAATAANHFAALGTYLANLRDDAKVERYSELSHQLERIVKDAPQATPDQMEKMFAPANKLFVEMNDDCVKSAKAAP